MKDHIENIRMVLEGISPRRVEIVQNTDYYPFGQEFEYNNLDKNKYLFGGKEIEDSWTDWEGKLLPLYDFGYRYYGTSELRWGGVDPLAEKYYSLSSYIYCNNNPIRYFDPDGRAATTYVDEDYDIILDTDDGSDDIVVVPDDEMDDFQKNVAFSDENRRNSIGWNNYWKSKFGLAGRQLSRSELSVLGMFDSKSTRRAALAYLLKPTLPIWRC